MAGGNVLVLDLGSSALKASVFAPDGTVIARAEAGWTAPGPHRQRPEDWWRAAREAVATLPRDGIAAISLAGTMENLIPVAADGAPLGEAVLYSDPCGAPHLDRRAADLDALGFQGLAGNAAEPLMTAFKLDWLREADPERFAAARRVLPGGKDFLVLCLTGRAVTDPVSAATTGLMDLPATRWSEALLDAFAIDRDTLPELLPATEIVGPLTGEAAAALGLEPGIPVVNGSGDGGATTLGSGAAEADDLSLYLGTSGWVARVREMPRVLDPRPVYRLPHPLGGRLIEIAPILSAGAAAAWCREVLGLNLAAAEAAALDADAGPGDVLFLPYLSGERSPFVDLDLRGGFLGLSTDTGPGTLCYAVMEGVAFAIAANIEAMGEGASGDVGAGSPSGRTSLVGGGAMSGVWPQIIADVLGTEVRVPPDPVSATSRGAFLIAAATLGLPGAGAYGGTVFAPRPERAHRIARMRDRFAAATAFARTLG